ncbi:MAG: hypothetical protein M1812_007316 [Candelaria pacifica]|nr:MAG: hypothetical protein M1812_007316 [Candelaria pacifica]
MPVYVIHGFRWPRPLIRVHVVLNNLDDASPEWLIVPKTQACVLSNFQKLYPKIMAHLPCLQFIEQHDEKDVSATATSQPFAFIADKVTVCGLSADVGEIISEGTTTDVWNAMIELRDKLVPGEKLGWYVVYNGDVERDDVVERDDSLERPRSAGLKGLFKRKPSRDS